MRLTIIRQLEAACPFVLLRRLITGPDVLLRPDHLGELEQEAVDADGCHAQRDAKPLAKLVIQIILEADRQPVELNQKVVVAANASGNLAVVVYAVFLKSSPWPSPLSSVKPIATVLLFFAFRVGR